MELRRLLFENARIGFSDIRRLFDAEGRLKPANQWSDDTAAAVASIETRELFGERREGKQQIGVVHKVKLWDKGAALERLMRHMGMFQKNGEPRTAYASMTDDELLEKLRRVAARVGIPTPPIRLRRRG